jgi:hypothetical protein
MDVTTVRTTIFATAITLGTALSSGCADSPAIQPASSSKSKFDESIYHGQTVVVSATPPRAEEFRVFEEGATGFVSMDSVRGSVEQRATDFCGRRGQVMQSLRETTAKPPYIMGNFPRIEIIFACVDATSGLTSIRPEDPKYRKLAELKRLLDTGVLTQAEFDTEKAKILSQP